MKDVLDVRARDSEPDLMVRIRWEDSVKPMNLVHEEAKRVLKGLYVQFVRWKDTWEPLTYMDDGKLKEKACMLLEDKYGA